MIADTIQRLTHDPSWPQPSCSPSAPPSWSSPTPPGAPAVTDTLTFPAASADISRPRPRVLGLDLSITATGICLPDGTTATIKTNPKHGDRRLNAIVTEIGIVLGDRNYGHDVDLVVLEEAPPGLKGPAIKAIHMVHGAVRLMLNDFDTPYAVINPTILKSYATGKSNADKPLMAVSAFKRAGAEFADDNQCDAAWLRWAGLDQLGHPQFGLPQAQRSWLTKAQWPAGVLK